MIGTDRSGDKVYLRALCDGDLDRRVEWMNDVETARLFTGAVPLREYERADTEHWRAITESDPKTLVWAVTAKGGPHIGDVDIHAIDDRIHSAKLTILIGDKAYWNCGCGTDTIRVVLRHAFTVLKFRSMYLQVFVFNRRAMRCYEKCGFTEISVVAAGSIDNRRPGEIHMMVSKSVFKSKDCNADTIHA